MSGLESYFEFTFWHALDVVFLGFVGGVLSGFLGTGGAFIMTPGMMNLGVPGVIAVGSNLAHKFGKSLMATRRHAELGHVDKKLGIFMVVTALIGVRIAVWLNEYFFSLGGESPDSEVAGVAGDLYISVLFVVVLSVIAIAMFFDVAKYEKREQGLQSRPAVAELFSRLQLPPLVYFPTADVTLSVWLVALVGLLTGFLAGSIGVGGFLGVPAMIYIFGIPTAVAAGTELFLAVFMGAFGAVSYAWNGYVDLRLVFLLYLGSLTGIYLGAYGTKVVKEKLIRLTTALVISISVLSRLTGIPDYLNKLGYISLSGETISTLNTISKIVLFVGGTLGVLYILINVLRNYRQRRRVRRLIDQSRPG